MLLQKARELSELLADTPQVRTYVTAEERMLNDSDVVKLRREMEDRLARAKVCSHLKSDDAEEASRAYQAAEKSWRSHPLVEEYEKAKEDLDLLMESLNGIIIHPITGQDGVVPGGCGGCPRRGAGCH